MVPLILVLLSTPRAVGYTTEVAKGVWVSVSPTSPMTLGDSEGGTA